MNDSTASTQPRSFRVKAIHAYGMWVFDDHTEGRDITGEPLVDGLDDIVDLIAKTPPRTFESKVEVWLSFSNEDRRFEHHLVRDASCNGGYYYLHPASGLRGWVCPVALIYFGEFPAELFIRVEPVEAETLPHPITVSPKADAYLRALKFNPDAGIISNYLPLMLVHWEDELTDETFLWDREDQFWIYILLCIRRDLWKGREVAAEDMEVWNHCLVTYPECPIFKRITVPQAILDDQLALEKETSSFLEDNGFEPEDDEAKT